jgi:hypothetical protein
MKMTNNQLKANNKMKFQAVFEQTEAELHEAADDDIERDAEEFKQGVSLAKQAFAQAVEAGWNPEVDPLPEVPDSMPLQSQEGFNAFGLNLKVNLGARI